MKDEHKQPTTGTGTGTGTGTKTGTGTGTGTISDASSIIQKKSKKSLENVDLDPESKFGKKVVNLINTIRDKAEKLQIPIANPETTEELFMMAFYWRLVKSKKRMSDTLDLAINFTTSKSVMGAAVRDMYKHCVKLPKLRELDTTIYNFMCDVEKMVKTGVSQASINCIMDQVSKLRVERFKLKTE
jgi:hypothetical protein